MAALLSGCIDSSTAESPARVPYLVGTASYDMESDRGPEGTVQWTLSLEDRISPNGRPRPMIVEQVDGPEHGLLNYVEAWRVPCLDGHVVANDLGWSTASMDHGGVASLTHYMGESLDQPWEKNVSWGGNIIARAPGNGEIHEDFANGDSFLSYVYGAHGIPEVIAMHGPTGWTMTLIDADVQEVTPDCRADYAFQLKDTWTRDGPTKWLEGRRDAGAVIEVIRSDNTLTAFAEFAAAHDEILAEVSYHWESSPWATANENHWLFYWSATDTTDFVQVGCSFSSTMVPLEIESSTGCQAERMSGWRLERRPELGLDIASAAEALTRLSTLFDAAPDHWGISWADDRVSLYSTAGLGSDFSEVRTADVDIKRGWIIGMGGLDSWHG